jgi:cytidylate kinase
MGARLPNQDVPTPGGSGAAADEDTSMDWRGADADRSARAARPVRRALFASDMHVHGGDPAGIARAVALLAHARESAADAVFLLGDVFLAWAGPRSLQEPGMQPFLEALRAATCAGLRVVLLHGNHDFMLGAHVERALGVEMPGRSVDVLLGGRTARLMHGDALCTRDLSYHRLHRVIRSTPFRGLVNALPTAAVAAIRDALLHSANREHSPKPAALMDIVDAEVELLLASGLDTVICGHVHRARDARFELGTRHGRLVVLADFERTGSHAVWADGRLELAVRDARFAPPPGPVVAIDGPAGSGKSAVSRALARRLGWSYLDSGALYRAVTARVLYGAPTEDLGDLVRSLCLDVDPSGSVLVDGRLVEDGSLRTSEVSARVSAVSADPALRAALMDVQHGAARRGRGLVAEGRDMSTVVFPDAALRVYLDARPEVRALRRARQSGADGTEVRKVASALSDRDLADSTRPHAPLRHGPGAERLDTSDLDLPAVVERLVLMLAEAVPDARKPPTD